MGDMNSGQEYFIFHGQPLNTSSNDDLDQQTTRPDGTHSCTKPNRFGVRGFSSVRNAGPAPQQLFSASDVHSRSQALSMHTVRCNFPSRPELGFVGGVGIHVISESLQPSK